MNEQQLCLFPESQSALKEAIEIFQRRGTRHWHFMEFVNALATAYKTAAPGATVVAACPTDLGFDEAMSAVKKQIGSHSDCESPEDRFFSITIGAPSALDVRQMRLELLDRYRAALNYARIRHRGQPRFKLEGEIVTDPILPLKRTDFGQLCEVLSNRRPSLVVVRDIQNLSRSGAPRSETVAAWRYLIDLAAQSGIPHLLCGNLVKVLEALKEPELRDFVDAYALRPYDISRRDAKASEKEKDRFTQRERFKSILHDYDKALPWNGKDRLCGHLVYIDSKVHGNPDRVRRWVVRALSFAVSNGCDALSWDHIKAASPISMQASLAQAEFDLVQEFYGNDADYVPAENKQIPKPKTNTRPVTRRISRDAA